MLILGIDPGATTGWCLYDDNARTVLAAGLFDRHHTTQEMLDCCDGAVCVIEGFADVHAGIYPETVHAARTCGRIEEQLLRVTGALPEEITRHDAKKVLHGAIYGEFPIKKDRDVWAALVLLHGEGSDRKPRKRKGVVVDAGGPLGGVTSHARAALAVAVAYALREGVGVA